MGSVNSSAGRGVLCGGNRIGGESGATENCEYITIATTGNGTDFGDLTVAREGQAGANYATRGCISSGHPSAGHSVIDYITIASTGNATDFGDMAENGYGMAGANEGL